MSHRIIIINNKSTSPAAETAEASTVEYEVTYTPDHALSPTQVGQKVGHMLKMLAKLDEPAE